MVTNVCQLTLTNRTLVPHHMKTRRLFFRALSLVLLGCWLACAPIAQAKTVLTLEQAIATALSQSPVLGASRYEMSAASEASRSATGRLWPQLDAYAGYQRLSDPAAVAPIKTPVFSRDQYRTGINLKIPIYHGGRLRGLTAIADIEKAIAKTSFEFKAQDLVSNVTNVFNLILYLKALRHAQQETLAALRKARDDAALKLKVGRIAPVDLMQIDTQVATQEQALIKTREAERRARQSLAMLLGWEPRREPDAQGTLTPAQIDLSGEDVARMIEDRPDVRRARNEVRKAEAAVKIARGAHLPSLDLVGDYGRRAGSGLEGNEEVWSAGVSLTLNLFSGGTISSQVREAKHRLMAARENLRATRLRAQAEVLQAVSSLKEAEHRLILARTAKKTAAESYRIEELRYKTGAGTVTDVLLAQAAWLNAQTSELAAIYDHQAAAVSYRLATGKINASYSRWRKNLHKKVLER